MRPLQAVAFGATGVLSSGDPETIRDVEQKSSGELWIGDLGLGLGIKFNLSSRVPLIPNP